MGKASFANDLEAESTRSRKSSRKDAKAAKESDCHFDQREKSFLDPSHFLRDDTPGVSLGDFAPLRHCSGHAWREKLRDFPSALPRWNSVMKIASHESRKNLK
jgi:hypothetical protein